MKYTEIKAWQKAHELTLDVYRMTKDFPAEEKFGITSQIRRACVSVEANLAEGSRKTSRTDFARFINIAEGSASEVEVLLKIASDVQYAVPSEILKKADELIRMLFSFRKTISDERNT